MTVSLCPLCGSPLGIPVYSGSPAKVECLGWDCEFVPQCPNSILIAAALAHHMRPLAEPHAFKANPDSPGQCDEAVGDPVQPCNRPKECHQ